MKSLSLAPERFKDELVKIVFVSLIGIYNRGKYFIYLYLQYI
jgi:hypothetical protein